MTTFNSSILDSYKKSRKDTMNNVRGHLNEKNELNARSRLFAAFIINYYIRFIKRSIKCNRSFVDSDAGKDYDEFRKDLDDYLKKHDKILHRVQGYFTRGGVNYKAIVSLLDYSNRGLFYELDLGGKLAYGIGNNDVIIAETGQVIGTYLLED